MKLTKELVGKRVRRTSWDLGLYVDLEWVRDDNAAGVDNAGISFTSGNAQQDNWEIVEPKKKPSEIIESKLAGKIYVTNVNRPVRELAEYANDRINAVIAYLDETVSNYDPTPKQG